MTPAQELTLAMEQVKLIVESDLTIDISYNEIVYIVKIFGKDACVDFRFVKTDEKLDKVIDKAFQECINRSWLK